MPQSDGKTIRQKMIEILTSKPEPSAIIQLFQFQALSKEQNKFQIRQAICLVLQNRHEWEKIMKCISFWKNFENYIRPFYRRMKERVKEEYDENIDIEAMMSEFQKLFEKHRVMYQRKYSPMKQSIDRYLTKDFNTHKNAEGQQKEVSNGSKKDHPIIKKDLTNKTIAPLPTQKADQSQKSNSLSSRSSNISNMRIQKKPTFGMLRRQDSSNSSSSNLVNRRNTSRRTFGLSAELKSIQPIQVNTRENLKQEGKNNKVEAVESDEPKYKILTKLNDQTLNQKKQEVEIKTDEPKKLNIFERKQQNNNSRPNPFLKSYKKQQNQNAHQQQQAKQKQKRLEASLSKSSTPQKAMVHRKKIILKKPSDFEQNFFDSDDQFSTYKKFQSQNKSFSQDLSFYSEQKQSFPLITQQEQELRMQIQSEMLSNSDVVQRQKNPQVQVKIVTKSKEKLFAEQKILDNQLKQKANNSKHSVLEKQKATGFKQTSIQVSMVRQPDQLFSDYEVSLMGFNPRGFQSTVDYFKIADKCKKWTWKAESKKWDDKIKILNERNKKIQAF